MAMRRIKSILQKRCQLVGVLMKQFAVGRNLATAEWCLAWSDGSMCVDAEKFREELLIKRRARHWSIEVSTPCGRSRMIHHSTPRPWMYASAKMLGIKTLRSFITVLWLYLIIDTIWNNRTSLVIDCTRGSFIRGPGDDRTLNHQNDDKTVKQPYNIVSFLPIPPGFSSHVPVVTIALGKGLEGRVSRGPHYCR